MACNDLFAFPDRAILFNRACTLSFVVLLCRNTQPAGDHNIAHAHNTSAQGMSYRHSAGSNSNTNAAQDTAPGRGSAQHAQHRHAALRQLAAKSRSNSCKGSSKGSLTQQSSLEAFNGPQHGHSHPKAGRAGHSSKQSQHDLAAQVSDANKLISVCDLVLSRKYNFIKEMTFADTSTEASSAIPGLG